MTHSRILVAAGTLALGLALAGSADAQVRRGPAGGPTVGRAVRRGTVRGAPSRVLPSRVVRVAPYRSFYGPRVGVGFYYGYPFFGGYPYAYAYSPFGYGYPAYGYGPYAYGYAGRPYGGVRIIAPDHDAEVYADGYYVGRVDDFDGVFQELQLDAGAHRIEIRAQSYAPIAFDLYIEPGRTITYRAALRNP